MICGKCGEKNSPNARFCNKCGNKLASICRIRVSQLIKSRYKIKDILCESVQQGIYIAEDEHQNKDVVLKLLYLSGINQDKAKAVEVGFKKEARRLLHLNHPSIPKTVDFFCDNQRCCLVMDYLKGQDIQAIMNNRHETPLPQSQVMRWLVQILDAMDYLHSQSPPIILRDFKPGHVLVGEGDRVFILDFGIFQNYLLAENRGMLGTAGFSAPEEYKGFADPRSDIYSLGAVLHYLLTGINPSSPDNPPFTFTMIRKVSPYITEPMEELVMKMLRMKMEERYQSVKQIMAAMKGLFSNVGKSRGLFSRGIAQYNKGEYDQALKTFSRAIVVNPENAKSYLWRGMCYEKQFDYTNAEKDYTRALNIDKHYLSALCNRGEIYYNRGEFEKSWDDYDRAISLDPSYAEAYKGRGLAAKELGDFKDAVIDFNFAIEIDPGYDEAFLWRGLTYYTTGEFGLAIEDFDRAIEINPDYEDAYMGRALAYEGMGNFESSIEDNTLAIEINPDSPSAYYGRGAAYRRLGSPEYALEDLNRALKLDPEYPDAFFERGVVLYEINRLKEAINDFTSAIKLDVNYAEAYKYRGKAYRQIGKYQESKKDISRYEALMGV